MFSNNIPYDLGTDIYTFSQKVQVCHQVNFPFIQILVPQLELSFKEFICLFISPCIAKQLRALIIRSWFLKVCLQDKLLITSYLYFRILQPKTGSPC